MPSKRHRRRNRHRQVQALRRAALLAKAIEALAAVREFQSARGFWVKIDEGDRCEQFSPVHYENSIYP